MLIYFDSKYTANKKAQKSLFTKPLIQIFQKSIFEQVFYVRKQPINSTKPLFNQNNGIKIYSLI
jgi:hypothetical protein